MVLLPVTAGNVAAQANGAAAATASSTLSGFPAIHSAAYLNDGFYGNGASWVSDASNSFVTLDLSQVQSVASVKIGRDRLGGFDDRDPGQFTIATSLDNSVYTTLFSSSALGYNGTIDGAQTLRATFASPVSSRYVRLTFANAGTAIDEIEVQAVPEPASLAAVALGGLAMLRRRRLPEDLRRVI